jgi:hypothetical protein
MSSFYVPILKAKQGEFEGLSRLSNAARRSIVPLLEVTPLEFDNGTKAKPKSIEEHFDGFCKKFITRWKSSEAFIDIALVKDERPDGDNPIDYIFERLYQADLHPMPVVRLSSLPEIIKAIGTRLLLGPLSEVGLRITIGDITASDFGEKIDNVLSEIGIKPHNCHLILDLYDSDFSKVEDFSDGIIEVLSDFPHFLDWATFTLAGGSFPATQLIKTGENHVPRNEWKFYNTVIAKLKAKKYNRKINFGDYSIVSPGYFEFDPRKMSRSANIRYTHNDIWFVIKGTALKTSLDFQQYKGQATKIMKSPYFLGEPFSDGDKHLVECSKGKVKTGNPTVWKRVGHNHHITKVVDDLFSN